MSDAEKKLPPPTDSDASAVAPAANNDAVATSATATATATRRSPSRTIRENVHTNVLGRDAGDTTRDIGFAAEDSAGEIGTNTNTNTNANAAIYDKDGAWWGSGLFGGANKSSNNESSSNANRKRRKGKARYDGLQQASALEDGTHYDPPPLSLTTAGSSSSVTNESLAAATEGTAATREDRVREDCSYFYRGMEDDPSSPYHTTKSHRGTGRSKAAANSLLRRMSMRARLSGQVDGALFMSRYERLNQVIDRKSRRSRERQRQRERHQRGQQYAGNDNSSSNEDNLQHDLFLEEDEGQDQPSPSSYREHIPSPTNNVVMDATIMANPHGVRSSMFFEQDGKMLMRLPRDQVRLVMDYNIEPGILSVEQWRSQEEAEATSEKLAMQNSCTKLSMLRLQDRERRHQRREKERRRRRKRRKQRELQKQQKPGGDRKNNINKSSSEGVPITNVEDPLSTKGSGQLPLEILNIEDPDREDDDDDSDCSYSYDDEDDDSYADALYEDLLPELRYVITIPDDIYRRMVGEMSVKIYPPCWGFFRCCNQESEHASIKLALLIMSVVMLLLFIGSLEWRTT